MPNHRSYLKNDSDQNLSTHQIYKFCAKKVVKL